MELTMSQRHAVSRKIALRYQKAKRKEKSRVLDELVELTGWSRDHARKALRDFAKLKLVKPRPGRKRIYNEVVIASLFICWQYCRGAAGKRLAPMLSTMVPLLRRDGDLELKDEDAELLIKMSAATIDRCLAKERRRLGLRGHSHTKPGTLLKSQIPVRTWAEWDEKTPGFVEIDLVGHEGGAPTGEHAYTLTVTDVCTGWTINRSVKNKAAIWIVEALDHVLKQFPFPIRGIDSDNGSEFINAHLLAFCENNKITFTRSRPGNKNDGCFVEQKNWTHVRELIGYERYDTDAELKKLNEIWELNSVYTNYLFASQQLVSKRREGAKIIKKYDLAKSPYQRACADPTMSKKSRLHMEKTMSQIRPGELFRQIAQLREELAILALSKAPAPTRPKINTSFNRPLHGQKHMSQ